MTISLQQRRTAQKVARYLVETLKIVRRHLFKTTRAYSVESGYDLLIRRKSEILSSFK